MAENGFSDGNYKYELEHHRGTCWRDLRTMRCEEEGVWDVTGEIRLSAIRLRPSSATIGSPPARILMVRFSSRAVHPYGKTLRCGAAGGTLSFVALGQNTRSMRWAIAAAPMSNSPAAKPAWNAT